MGTLKVRSESKVSSVARAIAVRLKQCGQVEVCAVGARAVNQATKAIAAAGSILSAENVQVWCNPKFKIVYFDEAQRTAISFLVIVQKNEEMPVII